MKITQVQQGDQITLEIDGRVDTNTSPQLQSDILKAFQSTKWLVLDFEKVSYISSAGLRALLIGQKTAASKQATMELIHVSPPVLSVLDSVGFSRVLAIR